MKKSSFTKELPPVEQLRGRPLGRILIKMGVLTREKVHECLAIQKERGGKVKIGEILVELGAIDDDQLQMAIAAQRGMEYVKLDGFEIPAETIEKVPAQMANTYRIIPIGFNKERNELTVALDNPSNFKASDDLSSLIGVRVIAKITDSEALESALKKYYAEKAEKEGISDLIEEMQGDGFLQEFEGRNAEYRP